MPARRKTPSYGRSHRRDETRRLATSLSPPQPTTSARVNRKCCALAIVVIAASMSAIERSFSRPTEGGRDGEFPDRPSRRQGSLLVLVLLRGGFRLSTTQEPQGDVILTTLAGTPARTA